MRGIWDVGVVDSLTVHGVVCLCVGCAIAICLCCVAVVVVVVVVCESMCC